MTDGNQIMVLDFSDIEFENMIFGKKWVNSIQICLPHRFEGEKS